MHRTLEHGGRPNTTRIHTLLALVLTFGLSTEARAGIIYSFVDYPSLQEGYTISGTITTDGHIGTLSSTDILAWSFTASKAGNPTLTLTSTDAGAAAQVLNGSLPGDVVSASLNDLTIAGPLEHGPDSNSTGIALVSSVGYYEFGYFTAADGLPLSAGGRGPGLWYTVASYQPSFVYADNGTPTEVVPEPASLTLALLGGLGVLGGAGFARWRRHIACTPGGGRPSQL